MSLVVCSWFYLCDRPAAGCVDHPILGWVPTCEHCAETQALNLVRGDVEAVQG